MGSAILYGPPGSGKTTLARIVAGATGAAFEELSAVSATVAQVRDVIARAREELGAQGRRTILFLDEIHRFNKAQQDALLPAVEKGVNTLIGATTENPYKGVNSALLSHCDVLELAWQTARAEDVALTDEHVEDAARKRPLVYDRGGDQHYDFASAFIKSMRGSDPDAAVYSLAAMLEGGEDARFVARRMIILASEDIGNADPQALVVAVAAAHALEHVGLPEARLNLAHAALYLAQAPKSNAVLRALSAASKDMREQGNLRPPKFLRHTHYRGAKKLGYGEGYVYPHDDPTGFEVDH